MRPIFMTTGTSVFGMLPLVLGSDSGSELYRGLGSVVLGGLSFATIFTLLVVPLLFSLVIDVFGAPPPMVFDFEEGEKKSEEPSETESDPKSEAVSEEKIQENPEDNPPNESILSPVV